MSNIQQTGSVVKGIEKNREERDFCYRRMKALEKLNQQYLRILERLLWKN
jgi:hypothetical protein